MHAEMKTCAITASILATCLLATCLLATAGDPPDRTLWYAQPAGDWQSQALPLGNGTLGCMVFGGVETEHLQFNVDSLWSGDENMVGKERGKGFDDSYLAKGMGFYQNFGSVHVSVDAAGDASGYRRELDLARAVHTVSYTRGGVRFTREIFCSHPAKVAIMRLTADAPGRLAGTIGLEDAHQAPTTAAGTKLTAAGALGNGMQFESQVRVLADGGEVRAKDGNLVFSNCNSLVLVLAADTDYVMDAAKGWKGAHPHQQVTARCDAVKAQDYDKLLSQHVADHQALFQRVELDLGRTDPAQAALPTDRRLEARRKGAADPGLTELLFQYGRYLLIASSRPGGLPANLQGVWNNSNEPEWHCDYHTNINVEMNYWLAEPANLGECQMPLLDYFTAASPLHRKASLIRFGEIRGFTMQTVNNIFGGCGWMWNMVGSAWIAQHFWEHYAFTQDKEYLRNTGYPYMKQVCEFWVDRLKQLPDGSLVVPDAWSPEQGPVEDGVSYDQEIVWDLFRNTIEAAEALGVDAEFGTRLIDMHRRLVTPKIGRWGQLQEWMTDRDDPKNDHRHTSHLFGVFPGRQISPALTPDFAKAAAVSLSARGETGDARRSWTWPWRCALWARLGEGDKAAHMIDGLFQYNLLPNMLATHPPLQLDGSFGIVAGICEMLVQSHAGHIQLLPALPAAWPSGSVTGLRARGGFEVGIQWQDGKLVAATVKSLTGNKCRVAYAKKMKDLDLAPGKTNVVRF